MQPNPRDFWTKPSTLILIAAIAGSAILMAGVIAVMAINAQRPAPQSQTQTVVVTRQVEVEVAAVTVLPGETAAPLATYTPQSTFTPFPTTTPVPTLTPAPTPTPVPPPQWRSLGNLSTVEYNSSTIVERQRPKPGIAGTLLGEDRIMLMAVGRVRAGVDLAKIKDSDVQIEGNRIRLRLPKVEVFSVELLPNQSRIYDSERSWLFSQYEGLELEAMEEARLKLLAEARADTQMLKIAESMARLQLREFLEKAGFERVEILTTN
jgi:hypothetical protein